MMVLSLGVVVLDVLVKLVVLVVRVVLVVLFAYVGGKFLSQDHSLNLHSRLLQHNSFQ